MRKIITFVTILLMFLIPFTGCGETVSVQSRANIIRARHGVPDLLDYEAFLELLESNGFSYEEVGETTAADSWLTVGSRRISIDDEWLTIFEYNTVRAMRRDSADINWSGTTIGPRVVTTVVSPNWFKRDLIIVIYIGENNYIMDFLTENLDLFAGGSIRYVESSSVADNFFDWLYRIIYNILT